MAVGEGKGKSAASDAVESALANPLFDAPLEGASGILFNIKGGKDLSLGQVDQVAGIVKNASQSDADVIFGVVQDPRWNKRVSVTLVATGLAGKATDDGGRPPKKSNAFTSVITPPKSDPETSTNGHKALSATRMLKLL